jgi:hypothetical protein
MGIVGDFGLHRISSGHSRLLLAHNSSQEKMAPLADGPVCLGLSAKSPLCIMWTFHSTLPSDMEKMLCARNLFAESAIYKSENKRVKEYRLASPRHDAVGSVKFQEDCPLIDGDRFCLRHPTPL